MKILFMLSMMFSVESFALIGTRGGGNARVCFTNEAAATSALQNPFNRNAYWSSIASIEVLDLYEARLPRGEEGVFPLIMDTAQGESSREFSERVAKRFDVTFPTFAFVIRKGRDAFSQTQIIWSPEVLRKTDDISPSLPYENKLCSILGMAHQKEVNGQEKIFIDQQLFQHPKHSPLSRHIAFLHEYIYQYARVRSHDTSAPTREAVGLAIAVLPKNIDKEKAEDWGLSIGAISQALTASDLIGIDSYQYPSVAHRDTLGLLEVQKDFSRFQWLLASSEEARYFFEKIHDIIFVRGSYYKMYGPLLGLKNGACRKDHSDKSYEVVLSACLAVTENENNEFTEDPILKEELRRLGSELRTFLESRAPVLAQDSILPLVRKDVEERFGKLKLSSKDEQKYNHILASFLVESINIRFTPDLDLTQKLLEQFSKHYISDVITSINKRTAEDPIE